jgi:hypothetical protein
MIDISEKEPLRKGMGRGRICFAIFLVLIACLGSVSESLAITKEQAVQIGNKEIRKLEKFGLDHRKWEVYFDENNKEWEWVSSLYKQPGVLPESLRYIEKQEARLRGKQYFAIRYRYDRNPGREVMDGVAWVFVERNSGKVLLFIKPG